MYILHLALLLTKKDKLKEFSFIIDNKLLFSNFSLRSSMEILYFQRGVQFYYIQMRINLFADSLPQTRMPLLVFFYKKILISQIKVIGFDKNFSLHMILVGFSIDTMIISPVVMPKHMQRLGYLCLFFETKSFPVLSESYSIQTIFVRKVK